MEKQGKSPRNQLLEILRSDSYTRSGKIGYILLWLLGVPIPVLLFIYLIRGCS